MPRLLKALIAAVLSIALLVIGGTVYALRWDRNFKRFCTVLRACTAYTQGEYKCHAEGAGGDVNVSPENLGFLCSKLVLSYPDSTVRTVPENDHFTVHYADGARLTVTRLGENRVHLDFLADYGDGKPIRFTYRMREDLSLTYDSLAQYVSLEGYAYPNKVWKGN